MKTKVRRPVLELKQDFGVGNCETCGSYSYTKTRFYLHGKLIFEDYSDTHLNFGPSFDDLIFLEPLFKNLGYEFIYNKESDTTDD